MTPAIVPLSPGERPTEPGWYVVEGEKRRQIVEIAGCGLGDEDMVLRAGQPYGEPISDFTFIARIYPDRIEGREG